MTELKDLTDAEYAFLIKRSRILDCLERGGVDNWDYYGDALDMYREEYEDEAD